VAPGGTSFVTPGLAANARPGANLDVIGDCDLTAMTAPVPTPAAACHARLADEDHVRADVRVVGDLHEVVDLGATADARLAEGGPIDAAVAADVHVVLDDHLPELRHLAVAGAVPAEAETIAADHGAEWTMQRSPNWQPRWMVTLGSITQSVPSPTPGRVTAGADRGTIADLHTGRDDGEGPNRHARTEDRVWIDHRGWVDARDLRRRA